MNLKSDRFVSIMSDTKKKFPISLHEMAGMFDLDVKTLKRLIDPNLVRSHLTYDYDFTENKDFIYVERKGSRNRQLKDLYVSLETFGKLVLRLKSKNGRFLQAYYRIIEKLYREWGGRAISTQTNKLDLSSLPQGQLADLFRITQNEKNCLVETWSPEICQVELFTIQISWKV